MSGILSLLVANSSGAVVNGVAWDAQTVAGIGVSATLTDTWSSSGTVGGSGGNWFLPTTTGIGSNYWIKFHRNSGNVFTTGSEDVWLSLAAGATVGWTATTTGKSWSGTVQIATDAAGTSIVSNNTLTMLLDRV